MLKDSSQIEIIVVHCLRISGIKNRDSVTLQRFYVFLQSVCAHVGEDNVIMASQKKQKFEQAISSGGAVLSRNDVVNDEDFFPLANRNCFPKVLLMALQRLRPFSQELRAVGLHPLK